MSAALAGSNMIKTSSQSPKAGPRLSETSFTWPPLVSCQTDVSTPGVDYIKAVKGGILLSPYCTNTVLAHQLDAFPLSKALSTPCHY